MKKFFTQVLASAILLLFVGFTVNAQDVLFEEQFDGGLNGWTVNTIDNDGVDTMEWTYYPTGVSGPLFGNATGSTIASPSAANGAVGVNFFYMRYGGDQANLPASFPYGQYIGEIISPTMNLDTVTAPLSITFFSDTRILNEADNSQPHTGVAFSIDDGATWSATLNANEGMMANDAAFNGMRTVNIPSSLGLQGSSTVKVKFIYNQDFYYWTIDDIMVITRPEVLDMQANTNFFAIPPNYSTPACQVDEFGFLVDVENVGGLAAENVSLNVRIQNSATGALVYEADQAYGTIAIDSLAENVPFGSFTPDATVANYVGTYSLTSDGTDTDLANNAITFEFEVTEGLFAKENGATRDVAPAADASFGYGCSYYIPNEGSLAKDITFGVANASSLPANSFITIKLLEWDGDLNEDGQAQIDDEFRIVSFSGYSFDGTEDDMLLTVPINIDGDLVPLNANKHYVALIEYADVSDNSLFFLANDEINYGAMRLRSDSLGAPRYASLLDVGGAGQEYSIIGFGTDLVPVVRLNVVKPVPVKELSDDNIVQVYPNPTADELNINLELIENTDVLNVKIVDLAGKILFQEKYDDIQSTTLEYDVRNYTSGSYMVHLETADGIKTIPFVIQK